MRTWRDGETVLFEVWQPDRGERVLGGGKATLTALEDRELADEAAGSMKCAAVFGLWS